MYDDKYMNILKETVLSIVDINQVMVFLFGSRASSSHGSTADADIGLFSDDIIHWGVHHSLGSWYCRFYPRRPDVQKGSDEGYRDMEQTGGYEKKLISLKQTLESFKNAMAIEVSGFDAIAADAIKNGQVQKFEICVELFWKTTKKFLYDIHGIESVSPKMAIKQLYRTQYTGADNYEKLIEMVNDRNRLNHIYNEQQFKEIYERLPVYLSLMRAVVERFV